MISRELAINFDRRNFLGTGFSGLALSQLLASTDAEKSNPLFNGGLHHKANCLLYTSPSPRDRQKSRMPSSA